MVKVIVAVPTFNRERLVGETLSSLVGQTYADRRVIVIDDGSTDNTGALIAGMQRDHPGVIDYHYQENQGEAAAVNAAWALADAEYFAVVSSDDPMEPDWLEEAVRFMDARPDVIVGYPDWNVIDEDANILWANQVFEYSPEALIEWAFCLPGPGTLIRRSALRDVALLRDPAYPLASDLECWLRLSLRGPFARIPHVLANWRSHDGAATKSAARDRLGGDFLAVFRDFFARPDVPPEWRAFRRHAMSRSFYTASAIMHGDHPLKAAYYYALSYLWAPREPANIPPGLRRAGPFRVLRTAGRRFRRRFRQQTT